MTIQDRRFWAKAFTWRICGTTATIILAMVVIRDIKTGLLIGSVDAVVKVILYYFHEKLWTISKFGIKKDNS